MTLDHVIDASFVLVSEAYVGLGMNVFEAIEKIEDIGKSPEQKMDEQFRPPPPQDEAANMALLQAQMRKTTFKGPRG